jgi:hypothetical protein
LEWIPGLLKSLKFGLCSLWLQIALPLLFSPAKMELEVYYKPITAKIHFQLQTKRSMDLQAGANCANIVSM